MVSSDRGQRSARPRVPSRTVEGPPRLREQNKERKRAALVRAGRALFTQRGFDETTTRAIAAKAGVASGTFFLYFREKRDLLFHIFKEEVSAVAEKGFAAPRDAPLVDRLVRGFGGLFSYYARTPRLSRVFLKELVFLDEGDAHPMMALTMSYVLRVAELVADAKDRGEIRADADPMLAASQAMAIYLFCLVGWFNGFIPSPELAVAHFERQLDLLMEGLARRKRR